MERNQEELTYAISIVDGFRIFKENEWFREVMRNGYFCWVPATAKTGLHEPHYLVIDDVKYVERGSDWSVKLTEYAQNNLKECALVFTLVPVKDGKEQGND